MHSIPLESKAWLDGISAYERGQLQASCPYAGHLADEWCRGWLVASTLITPRTKEVSHADGQ